MSSPWDPAISQAMQRHGGSNKHLTPQNKEQAAKPTQTKPTTIDHPSKNPEDKWLQYRDRWSCTAKPANQ